MRPHTHVQAPAHAWEAAQLSRPAGVSTRKATTCITTPAAVVLTHTPDHDTKFNVDYTVKYAGHHPPSRTVCFVLPSACSRPMVPHALPIVCRMKYMSAGPGPRPPAAAVHATSTSSAHQAACLLNVMQHITSTPSGMFPERHAAHHQHVYCATMLTACCYVCMHAIVLHAALINARCTTCIT